MRILFLILLVSFQLQGQTDQADHLLQQGDFTKAADAYMNYLSKHPGDSLVMYKLGRTYAGMQLWNKSSQYYDKALDNGFPSGPIHYQKARNLLQQEKTEEALKHLRYGADNGMRNYIALKLDPLFEPLHDHTGWPELLKKVEKNTYPCISDPNYRHFDFWLGTWDVYRKGTKVGENRITLANGGCAIHESYTTYPRDYTGQSINFYNPLEKRWQQHWVGSGGDVTNYYESDRAANMIEFTGKMIGNTGTVIQNRMTFTGNEDGSVRQLIETSTDDGQSWSTTFDGLYKAQKD